MTNEYEVLIAGGGIVGASLACILAHGGIEVALVDRNLPAFDWPEKPKDIRVSALTKASQNIFTKLNVWPQMLSKGVCPYKEMRVWDVRSNGELHFDCADTPFTELGFIVENRVTVSALWRELEKFPNVTRIVPDEITQMLKVDNGRIVELAKGRKLTAELVVAADGRESPLRTMAGIGTTGWDYKQKGLVATVRTEKSHQSTAWQRFLEQGPLAFLPLDNGDCSIVWTLSTETAEQYLEIDDADFIDILYQNSGGILGKILTVGPRAAFPLKFQFANRYIDDNFVLIGDAAHAMHPLAGQGANAGLLDAAALAELMIDAKREGRPVSSKHMLRAYERWRKGDNLIMQTSMDFLNKTYTVSNLSFARLRSLGMNWINQNDFIKSFLNFYAMGLREDLPKLTKGKVCW